MNAGLGNLDTMRRHLLAGTIRSERRFDDALLEVGRVVAASFERHCNRVFGWEAGSVVTASAGRSHLVLPRYPVASVSRVRIREGVSAEWEELTGEPYELDAAAGLVRFSGELGDELTVVEVTYDGGYWWETLEPEDEAYPSAKPEGAAALPDGLRMAWLMQCRAVWASLDKTGVDVLRTGSSSQFVTGSLTQMELAPMVRELLNGYVRYALS